MRKRVWPGNLSGHVLTRLSAQTCILGFVLLCSSCQPTLPPDGTQPRVPPHDAGGPGEQPNGAARPVPVIEWSEPPPCERQSQGQRRDQDPAQAGDQNTVCARLLYRVGEELREITWTEDGLERDRLSLADVPEGITSFSPDLSEIVVQTPHGHAAGGPLYFYDLKTRQLHNLNELLGLPTYTSVSALRVAGWSPEGGQLLLVNEDDEVTIWLDLEDESYRALNLGIDSSRMAPPRHFNLAPDGSGFTFITHVRDAASPAAAGRDAAERDATDRDAAGRVSAGPDAAGRDAHVSHLYWYDLATDQTRLLLTVPAAEGRLAATAVAPDGSELAYLLMRGGRAQGRSEEVHLLDLSAERSEMATGRLLFSGNLVPTRPVWSPDGEHIALIQRNLDEPLRAGPRQPPPLGDIWTIATESGDATRITSIAALEQPPVWSRDGRYLAFVTADGQIGMVAAGAPGQAWKLDDPSLPPQFIQIAFAPRGPVR